MVTPQLVEYVQRQLAQGVSKEVTINVLVTNGWQKNDVDEAFNSISSPLAAPQNLPLNQSQPITEKDYPIQLKWIFKFIISFAIPLVIAFFLLFMKVIDSFLIIMGIFIVSFIIIILDRKNFHYWVEDKFMILKQGILSRQERNIPYGVIQNIFVKQDLLDRILGLASLSIENAAYGGRSEKVTKIFGLTLPNSKKQKVEKIGFEGNKINIPGLKKEDAETLKGMLLEKIKLNPIEESGL